jgi:hypothetical protein
MAIGLYSMNTALTKHGCNLLFILYKSIIWNIDQDSSVWDNPQISYRSIALSKALQNCSAFVISNGD